MTDHQVARLLMDLIHIFTRMETNMVVVFDGLQAAFTDLNSQVAAVSAAVAALPQAGTPAPSIDEAAIQAQIDGYMSQVKALTDQLAADVAAINAKSVPPAV